MSPNVNSSWMLATIMVTLILALAATSAERVATLRRGIPLRFIWGTAMVCSFAYALMWLRTGTRESPKAGEVSIASMPQPSENTPPQTRVATQLDAPSTSVRLPQIAHVLPMSANAERILRWIWLAVSVAMILCLLWSVGRLSRQRRTWRRAVVQGTDVHIADDFGPAVVGILRPIIVLPPWAITLDVFNQRAVLLHECEHRRAGDQRALLGGLALLALMPWNVGLWFMWRRLSRAIEFDCDERVVSHGIADADYARVLLGAWQRAHGMRTWVPTPAFAERASGLGQRVEHLMRPLPQRWMMQAMNRSLLTLMLTSAVLLVPAPQQAQPPAKSPPPPAPSMAGGERVPPRVVLPLPSRLDVTSPPRNMPAPPSPPIMRENSSARVIPATAPSMPAVVRAAEVPTVVAPSRAAGRLLLVPMDDASVGVLESVRIRLAEDTVGRALVVIPWSEAKLYLIASGYPATPMYHQARDLRALTALLRADIMIALSANARAGVTRMEATVGSGNQFRFYDFTESGSGNAEPLSDVVTRALRSDSAYVQLRRP